MSCNLGIDYSDLVQGTGFLADENIALCTYWSITSQNEQNTRYSVRQVQPTFRKKEAAP